MEDKPSVVERIFQRVKKSPTCWEWLGAKTRYGHGRIKVEGKLHSPHRLIYEHYNGSLLAGIMVCHRCDNPACVRPSHLFAGNHSDNMKDCAVKGRLGVQRDPSAVQGEKRSTSKLTDDAVREIRRSSLPVKQLARKFGVHHSIVQKVIKRQRWAHVSDEVAA